MSITVGQIASWVNGTIIGDPSLPINRPAPLDEARTSDLSFLESKRFLKRAEESAASAILVHSTVTLPNKTIIQVDDPLSAFVEVIQRLLPPPPKPMPGIDPSARIHPTAVIAPDASIDEFVIVGPESVIGPRCHVHAGVVIGSHCRLGENVILYPRVVLYDRSVLGNRVIVHANAVIGADGFGYRTREGKHVKIPQLGHVEIADDVEIGACTTVDRGTFGATTIGVGSKLDNHVQIAHNCRIGAHNLFAAQVGIAGSSQTGDYVVMAGQSGISDHCTIGDRVMIGAQTGVIRDIPAGTQVWGTPARVARQWMKILSSLEYLPELIREWRQSNAEGRSNSRDSQQAA